MINSDKARSHMGGRVGYENKASVSLMEETFLKFLDQLIEILDFDSYKDIRTFLKLFLQRSRMLLNVDYLCMYHVNSERLSLTKLASIEHGKPFPQSFSLDQIQLPYLPEIWHNGSNPTTELQEFAKNAGLKFLSTYPLGKAQEFFGLITAGGTHCEPDSLHLKKLQMISSIVEIVFQKHILLDAMQNRLDSQSKAFEFQKLISQYTKDGVLILDPTWRVIEMNNAAEQILGYTQKEVLLQPVLDVLVGADGLVDALEVAGAGIETRELGIVSLHRRNGQAFSAHVQSFPIMDEKDRLRAVLIMISDESENEQNRIKVQHLEQRAALGGLSAVFAHEVRNPINNISTAVQLIKARIPEDDPNYEVLGRIQGDCARLNTLMESVLAFSRPLEPKLRPMNISVYLTGLIERWRPRFDRLNIGFVLQKPHEDLCVMGDPRLLEQVFTNLISNAVDVMEKTGGSLAIKLSRNDLIFSPPQVEVAISDTGPGIPDDIIEKIFSPFVSTKPKGTGLGLAITKHMVTAQHGTIRVSSFPGGSVFYVCLPEHRGE